MLKQRSSLQLLNLSNLRTGLKRFEVERSEAASAEELESRAVFSAGQSAERPLMDYQHPSASNNSSSLTKEKKVATAVYLRRK